MKRHNYKQDQLCIRISDNSIFIPSYPNDYNEFKALADCISGRIKWYFRKIIKKKKWLKYYWEETGEIWEPKDGSEFKVVTYKEIEK